MNDAFEMVSPIYADNIFLQFLEEFLQYLDGWKNQTLMREGFSKQERGRMFLSTQTHEGVRSTGICH